eukprot:3108899-Prymnesium_polylepis.1
MAADGYPSHCLPPEPPPLWLVVGVGTVGASLAAWLLYVALRCCYDFGSACSLVMLRPRHQGYARFTDANEPDAEAAWTATADADRSGEDWSVARSQVAASHSCPHRPPSCGFATPTMDGEAASTRARRWRWDFLSLHGTRTAAAAARRKSMRARYGAQWQESISDFMLDVDMVLGSDAGYARRCGGRLGALICGCALLVPRIAEGAGRLPARCASCCAHVWRCGCLFQSAKGGSRVSRRRSSSVHRASFAPPADGAPPTRWHRVTATEPFLQEAFERAAEDVEGGVPRPDELRGVCADDCGGEPGAADLVSDVQTPRGGGTASVAGHRCGEHSTGGARRG